MHETQNTKDAKNTESTLFLYLFETSKVHLEDYERNSKTLRLHQREQEDHFKTLWKELDKNSFEVYSEIYRSSVFDYSKIEYKGIMIYTGSLLSPEELQSKLKHFTRFDCKTS